MMLVTHDGTFHADDVLAYVILSSTLILENVTFVRTRDPDIIMRADIAFDVGGGKYDHHTKDKPRRKNGMAYSSAGLIWRDFGLDYLKYTCGGCTSILEILFEIIDNDLITYIDNHDNGEYINDIDPFSLPYMISTFNGLCEDNDTSFMKATEFMRQFFNSYISKKLEEYLDKFDIDDNLESMKLDDNDYILASDKYFSGMNQYIHDNKLNTLFTVYPSDSGDAWYVRAVNTGAGYDVRYPFPDEWCGEPVDVLKERSGVDSIRFVHPNGFLAVVGTKEDALIVARIMVKRFHDENNLT